MNIFLVYTIMASEMKTSAIITMPRAKSQIALDMTNAVKAKRPDAEVRIIMESAYLTVDDLVAIKTSPYISKFYQYAVAMAAWRIASEQNTDITTRTVGEDVMVDIMNMHVRAFQNQTATHAITHGCTFDTYLAKYDDAATNV